MNRSVRTRRAGALLAAALGASSTLVLAAAQPAHGAGELIGNYEMCTGSADPDSANAIAAAGATSVPLNDVSAGSLAGLDGVFITNCSNGGYGAEYLANLADLQAFAEGGGIVIIHDRRVTEAATSVPGAAGIAFTGQTYGSEVELDEASGLTTGPGGTLTDASLDGGNSSTHGYADVATLPAGSLVPLTTANPAQAVTFCYGLGAGSVTYSTIPLDYYLNGSNPAAFRTVYAPNVIEWAITDCGGAPQQPTERALVTVTASAAEAEEGGEPGAFTITRTGDRFSTLTVVYTVSGTAENGTDYEELSGIANFAYGETTVIVPVTALADGVPDAGETVTLQLEFGEYDRREPQSATVTIVEGVEPACANVPDSNFDDMPETNEHESSLDCLVAYGLARGYPDNTYRPTLNVSRAQMASFVARLLSVAGVELPASPPDAFPGDDAGTPHEMAINQLAALGMFDGTTGESDGMFHVSDDMRRDDMAQILVNAYRVITGDDLPAGPDAFGDDEGTDADGTGTDNEDAINALAAAGVVEGTGGGNYDPDGAVSRGQFASFFARYLGLLTDNGVELNRPTDPGPST